MKRPAAILVLLIIVTAGLLLLREHLGRARANVPPPAKALPASFTDSNGNQFTVYLGGAVVNGTNIVVSNRNVKFRPVQPATPANQQTNETSK